MYKITRTISLGESKEIEIIPTGCWHLGNPNSRIDKIKRLIDWATPRPNTYFILMGDLLECILPDDDRYDSPNEYSTLDDLREELINMLEPIKGRVICALSGNHEWTLLKKGYGDPTKHLCKRLQVKYGGFSAYIKLTASPRTHEKSLVIWTHHGWFSGRKRGSKVNNLEDNLANYDADIFLAGHSHDLWATRRARIYWAGARDIIFANTGSFLETAKIGTTSYSERANYPVQKLGVVKLKWLPYEGKIYVSE